MPLVKSIDYLGDGVSIVTSRGQIYTFTSSDVPNGATLQQVEGAANARLGAIFLAIGEYISIKVISLVPLKADLCVSNDPIPPDYWATRP